MAIVSSLFLIGILVGVIAMSIGFSLAPQESSGPTGGAHAEGFAVVLNGGLRTHGIRFHPLMDGLPFLFPPRASPPAFSKSPLTTVHFPGSDVDGRRDAVARHASFRSGPTGPLALFPIKKSAEHVHRLDRAPGAFAERPSECVTASPAVPLMKGLSNQTGRNERYDEDSHQF